MSVQQTLLDYETTLKGTKDKCISELEGEARMLHGLNLALEEKVGDLEIKLRKTRSSKEGKVAQLSEQLEGNSMEIASDSSAHFPPFVYSQSLPLSDQIVANNVTVLYIQTRSTSIT